MHKHASPLEGGGTALGDAAASKAIGYNYQLITDHRWSDTAINPLYGEYLNGNIDSANLLYGSKDFHCDIGIEYHIYTHFILGHIYPPGPLPASWPSGNFYDWTSEKYFCHWADSMGAWISAAHPGPPVYVDSATYSFRLWGFDTLVQLVQEGLKGFEAYNGGNGLEWLQSRFIWRVGGWWDQILQLGYRFYALSGTDFHSSTFYNRGANRVYILSDSVTYEAYWEALFAGRFYMTAGNGAMFAINMNVTVGDSMMGSTVLVTEDYAEVRLEAAVDTAYARSLNKNVPQLDTVRVISNGAILAELYPNRVDLDSIFRVPVDSVAYMRVEIEAKNLTDNVTVRGLSNPIFLRKSSSSIVGNTSDQEKAFDLEVHPNPFNPSTKITVCGPLRSPAAWQIVGGQKLELSIYNIYGKQIQKFSATGKQLSAGLVWDTAELSSGVYMIRIRVGNKAISRPVTLLR
ncbi:MAG: hypothetical protein A2350_07205 [Candidatus Raymondbacteria bacterium RifOxyB12_full_50_8]|nr:MAG: hypothetical protein A2350_07205 [Candidatus Raymondbacteria bacterium RifOxyB12_full_50_8]